MASDFSEILFIIIFFCLIVLGLNQIGKRFFESSSQEIQVFLEKEGLTLKEKRKPKESDWENSPYKKPPIITFGFVHVKILGSTMPITETQFYVLETHQNITVWLKIEHSVSSKAKLSFERCKL